MIVLIGLCLPKQVNAQNQAKKEPTIPLIYKSAQNYYELSEPMVINNPDQDSTIFTVVEQMPQYPSGESELLNFVDKNLKYPESAIKNKIQGKVVLRFVVTEKGAVDKVEILRSLDPACDKECIRVIKTLPKFIPGKQNGVNVNVWYTIPIIFKID